MKTVAILGTGVVGQTLAQGLRQHGYDVVMGTQRPDKVMEWNDASMAGTRVLSYEEAAKLGELIVLCTKGLVAEEVVKRVADHLAGKTVMDTTNPIADRPPEAGVLSFFTDLQHSLMERLQAAAPQARFVKAFSSVGSSLMVHPALAERPSMFICGNSAEAKAEVAGIVDAFGWDTEDMGGVIAARAIEPLCMLWCIPGFQQNDWAHAFKVLRPQ